MKLSIIIPTFNEERTILFVIDALAALHLPFQHEVVVVDDGSTDATWSTLQHLKKKKFPFSVRLLRHMKNKGKGAVLKTAFRATTGEIILIQDADLEYEPKEIPSILQPILDKKAVVVFGSRIIKMNRIRYPLYYFGNIFLSIITSLLYVSVVTDMETGYKAFRKEALQGIDLHARRFDVEPELTAKLLKKGYKIHQVPITYICRSKQDGKKISWKDGFSALWCLVKYRFVD